MGDESLKNETFKVQCVVASAPISSFIDEDINQNTKSGKNRSSAFKFFKAKYADSYDIRKKLSPITYLSKDSPKIQIPHGNNDSACPVEDSRRMHKASVGLNEIEFIEIEGADHGLGKRLTDPLLYEYKEKREFELFKEYLLKGIEKL